MLGRILIIGVLAIAVLWLLRKTLGGRKSERVDDQKKDQAAALVACAHCGAHLPKSDAYWKEGHSYCSLTHRNLGPKRGA
jgi:uncharacterized protein